MDIVHVPNNVLNTPVKKVKKIDKRIKGIVADMITALEGETDPEGVGLAANQVGLSMAIFIMKPEPDSGVTICINPTILETKPGKRISDKKNTSAKEEEKQKKLEGCLSIPLVWGHVDRSPKVQLAYTDLSGKKQKKWFSGFEARIVLHEMDHLNGILFTQRVLEQKRKLYKEVDGELEPYSL